MTSSSFPTSLRSHAHALQNAESSTHPKGFSRVATFLRVMSASHRPNSLRLRRSQMIHSGHPIGNDVPGFASFCGLFYLPYPNFCLSKCPKSFLLFLRLFRPGGTPSNNFVLRIFHRQMFHDDATHSFPGNCIGLPRRHPPFAPGFSVSLKLPFWIGMRTFVLRAISLTKAPHSHATIFF